MNTNKLTKLVGLSSLLLMSSAAHAWNGYFLLGAEGGYGSRNADLELTITQPAPAIASATSIRNWADNGGVWGVFGGYQAECNNLVLGLELAFTWQDFGERKFFHTVDTAANQYGYNAVYERDSVFALTARAGYYVMPWMMPYLRVGAETSDDNLIIGGTNVTTGGAFATEVSKRDYRFTGGAGLEFPFMEQAALRLEYNYSSRGSTPKATSAVSISGQTVVAEIDPNQHTGLAALVWYFK